VSQLILEHLNTINQGYAGSGDTSGYYIILDTLVTMCDVPKMQDAIDNFNARPPSVDKPPFGRRALNDILLNRMGDPPVLSVLRGCDMLLKALTEMDLTECHKMTPLLTGDQIKQVLKNIPKGTMFGEVSQFRLIMFFIFFQDFLLL
jgi:hypothetical protein